jgi:hypothetical protein
MTTHQIHVPIYSASVLKMTRGEICQSVVPVLYPDHCGLAEEYAHQDIPIAPRDIVIEACFAGMCVIYLDHVRAVSGRLAI